ncbi:MAG: hypothetical protein KA149_05975, partial [Chitinophagales bacterium]|nr:hypothetical protein [Chitinophagales bacterium]
IARQLSTSGYFDKAHEVFTDIKDSVERNFIEYKTVFYVNYVTNLVKCQRYTQALQILDGELIAANALYKNMLLQNRLLCYLNLRDVKSLSAYISFNLDEAPFPQSYMLKLIKSAYFYLVGEYDLAAQLVANLQQTKDANNRLHTFKPIAGLYKKFYSAAIKNKGLKRWDNKDVAALVKEVERIETTSLPEMKLVSVYSWIKGEIAQKYAKIAL